MAQESASAMSANSTATSVSVLKSRRLTASTVRSSADTTKGREVGGDGCVLQRYISAVNGWVFRKLAT
eukprot:8119147-Alexandrium_andersonii.AAC.1